MTVAVPKGGGPGGPSPVVGPWLVGAAIAVAVAACGSGSAPVPAGSKVELIDASATGDLAQAVATEVARGAADRVPVVVYVGAEWCQPCLDFHAAAVAGQLDRELGPVRFVSFDLDRDGERLAAAGYRSALVPLFARPGADGRATGTQTEGAKMGRAYVPQLVPRIRALVEPGPPQP